MSHQRGIVMKEQLRGKRRKHLGTAAMQQGPSELYHELIQEAPQESLRAANYSYCQSKNVLKKAAHELRSQQRLDTDVLREMLITQSVMENEDRASKTLPGFIQFIGMKPFEVFLYSEDQFRVYEDKKPLFFDATGSIASKIPGQDKRILHYSLVSAGAEGEPPLPVAEMTTNSHRTSRVTAFLLDVRQDYKRLTKNDLSPAYIVTDYSWALIHSCLMAFNEVGIIRYLEDAYRYIENPEAGFCHQTVLFLCSAHITKLLVDKLKDLKNNRGKQKFFKYLIARLIGASDVKKLDNIIHHLTIVCCSKDMCVRVEESLKTLQAEISHETEEMDDVEDINISIEDLASNTLYEKSVFYRRFIEIKGRAEAHIPQGDEENSYYYPDFPDLIIRYLAFAPLWTAILLEPICAINRATNCYVELWFRILKREVLKNKTRPLRVTEFVQRLRSSLIGRVLDKQLKLDRERDSEEVYVAPEKAQEKWNKRKKGSKKKRTYFDKPSELPKAKKETKKKSKEKKKNSKHLKRPEKTIEVESSSEGENKNDANTKVRKRKLGKEMPRKKRCIRKDIITLSSEEIDQELDNEKGKPTKAKATKGVKNNAPQQKQKKTESKRKQRNIWEKRVMSRFKHNNLKKMAVPFGGEYRRKELINTCTIDVGLSVMTYLSTNKAVKAMINNMKQEDPNYQWLEKCIEEVSAQNYSSAKYSWVTKVLKLAQTRAGGYNVYGSEVDRFVQHICGHQEYLYQTICSMDSCPKMSKTITKRDIVFQVPDHVHNDAFLQACAREWMSHFTTKCDQTYNVSGNDSTLDDDENVKWQEYFNADGTSAGFRRIAHCSGERTHLKSFKKDPPPMLVIDCTNLDNFLMDTDFEEVFEIDFMRFEVIAVTIMRNNHNTAHFRLPNGWVKYDGMASRSIQTEEGFNCQGLQHIYCVQIPSK